MTKYSTETFTINECRFELKLDPAGMQCRLSAEKAGRDSEISVEAILDELNKRKVVKGIDAKIMDLVQKALAKDKRISELIIARGQMPEEAVDGYVEFFVKVSDKPEYHEDENGKVDFHDAHLIQNVKAGDLIGRIHPPTSGKAGFTVFGDDLPFEGKPTGAYPKFTVGDGAKRVAHRDIVALKDGRVLAAGGQVSVTDQLMINGNVDYYIGHIDFVGSVVVNGDVMDGFNIKAGKDIAVKGMVGHCHIQAGGNAKIAGMVGEGDEGTSIKCKGNLNVGYLRNVDAECLGDVIISREAIHCRIRTIGQIVCMGMIAGGEYTALSGMESAIWGSDAGVKTKLLAGFDYRVGKKLISLKQQLEKNVKIQGKLNQQISPFLRLKNPALITDGRRSLLKEALLKVKKLKFQQVELDKAIETITKNNESKNINPKLNVTKALHCNVAMQLGEACRDIHEDFEGKFSVIACGEECLILNYSSLKVNAKTLQHFAALKKKAKAKKSTD